MSSSKRLWVNSGKDLRANNGNSEMIHEQESEVLDNLCHTDIGGIARGISGHHLSGTV